MQAVSKQKPDQIAKDGLLKASNSLQSIIMEGQ